MFLRVSNIHRKTPVLESNFLIFVLLKKTSTKAFSCKCCKILKSSFFCGTPLFEIIIWLHKFVPYSECPTLYSSVFCSSCLTWNSIYAKPGSTLVCSREFRLENTVIWRRAFGLERTCGCTELSEVWDNYLECSILNISTIQSLALYKIWLRLEQRQILLKRGILWHSSTG